MSEVKELSPEEVIKHAWQRWREMDFSWKGLAEPYNVEVDDERGKRQVDLKINDGSFSTTLQQYWLTDLKTGNPRTYDDLVANGEIIEAPEQKPYHIVHLPLFYDAEETQPTLKQREPDKTRQKISEIISERILAIWEPKGEKRIFNYLWLNGAILQNVEFDHSKRKDQLIAVFDDAIFTEYFELAHFSKNVAADFERVSFLGYANFSGVEGNNALSFKDTHFLQDANFSKVNFSILEINKCLFIDGCIFYNSDINHLNFYESTFKSDFYAEYLSCKSILLSYVTFNNKLMFKWSKFSEYVLFNKCYFINLIQFFRCTISEMLFQDGALYDRVTFYGSNIETLDFEGTKWPKEPAKCRRAFENTTFHGSASFIGSAPTSSAAFYGALFKRDARFDQITEGEATARFQKELKIARNYWQQDASKLHILLGNFGIISKQYQEKRDQLLMEIESGCRALKQAMANAADKNMEQVFYRFETLARRYQSKTSIPEKAISKIYQVSSRYGASYMRPMAGLIAIWLIFSVAYWPLSKKSEGLTWPYLEQSITYISYSNAKHEKGMVRFLNDLPPFSPPLVGERYVEVLSVSASRIVPFGAFGDTSDEFAKMLDTKGKWAGFAFKLLGTLESFWALTLAFMFGLSVRRRFQID